MAADVDGELTAREAAVLDALYGDEAGGLDDEQRRELGEWQAVRGVVRHAREHGFDQEPPAAGTRGSMELLLTAARAHAPAEPRGLWARLTGWMTALVAHPALAGAAALVVVGGAAGLLYVKGKHRVAEPPAAARAPAPATVSEGAPTPGEPVDVGGAADDGEAPAKAAEPGRGVGEPETESAEPASGVGEPEAAGSGGGGGPARPRPRPTRTAPTEARADGIEWRAGTGTGTGTIGGAAGGEAPRAGGELAADQPAGEAVAPRPPATTVPPPAAPPAPSAPPPPPARTVERDGATSTLSGSRTPAPARAPVSIAEDEAAPATPEARRAEAVRLTAQARAAARAGQCATVATRSRQVQALDAAYHRDVFVRDPDLARCL